jgi:hypothetical protein
VVLRALITRLRAARMSRDAHQLALEFTHAPRTGAELLVRLKALGLRGVKAVALTRNRSVMVSLSDGTLRVHRAFLAAPEHVHKAIVRFLMSPRRAERIAARRVLLSYPVRDEDRREPRAPEKTHPDDEGIAAKLTEWHAKYNTERFHGALKKVTVRVSRRMRARLGHYAPSQHGRPSEIAISRRHLRRHSFAEGLETLLHEMVHQWQDEQGYPLGHDRKFREKARAVGISGRAKRVVD